MFLIKYSETTQPTNCSNCDSTNLEPIDSGDYACDDCGEETAPPEQHFYLNHAYLSGCAFGSLDMAWSTEDKEKAELMLYKVQQHHPDNLNIIIEEY